MRENLGRRLLPAVVVATSIMLSACGKEVVEEDISYADNNPCNNSVQAIWETETGYYYNYGCIKSRMISEDGKNIWTSEPTMYLRYYDKETKETYVLCAKPECEHTGAESCVATYRNLRVINTIMYNNSLYVYGSDTVGNIVSLNLYKVALDGSTIDKVATILEAENTLEEEVEYIPMGMEATFIIHRNVAYLPYYMKVGKLTRGFKGGGLAKVDLATGEVTTITEMSNKNSAIPHNLFAVGDYVYATMSNASTAKGTMRYNIVTGDFEHVGKNEMPFRNATEDRLYQRLGTFEITEDGEYVSTDNCSLLAYDLDGEHLAEEDFLLNISNKETSHYLESMIYDNKFVCFTETRVLIYDLAAENRGTLLGEIAYERSYSAHDYRFAHSVDFSICNGYIYRTDAAEDDLGGVSDSTKDLYLSFAAYNIYRCSLEDVCAGNGSWEKVFSTASGR